MVQRFAKKAGTQEKRYASKECPIFPFLRSCFP
jgi:hypothetical protein